MEGLLADLLLFIQTWIKNSLLTNPENSRNGWIRFPAKSVKKIYVNFWQTLFITNNYRQLLTATEYCSLNLRFRQKNLSHHTTGTSPATGFNYLQLTT